MKWAARLWNQIYVRVLAFTAYSLCGHEKLVIFRFDFPSVLEYDQCLLSLRIITRRV